MEIDTGKQEWHILFLHVYTLNIWMQFLGEIIVIFVFRNENAKTFSSECKDISCSVLKLYVPSTLNIDLILWHTQLIVCAENFKSWFKSWGFPFTFQAYICPIHWIVYVLAFFNFIILERF